MRLLLDIVSILLIVAAFLLVWGRWHESRSLFVPSAEHEHSPQDYSLKPEEVWLASGGGGEKIHGWYFAANRKSSTILYVHGNAGTIADRLAVIKGYIESGYNVFIFDFRGFGKSDGKPDRKSFVQDTFTAYDYLTKSRGAAASDIVLLGQSLGGAAALKLANAKECRAVILEGTFYSIRQVARDIYPNIPIWLLASSYFDNSREVKKLAVPLLLIHGENDEVTPYYHSEMLFKDARKPKEFINIKGSDHTGMYIVNPAQYYGTIGRFIEGAQK
ncbi:MAG: alpha/beta hydrolase [bacterium]|nr:MAG: alpha/beta hydrolase [bacterium]